MIDHVTINTNAYDVMRHFYKHTLEVIGYEVRYEQPGVVAGFGATRPVLWISRNEGDRAPTHAVHVAFECKNADGVKAFYAAALAAGGTDNGAPDVRPKYGEKYFACFVLDPDGNNIEAVSRQ